MGELIDGRAVAAKVTEEVRGRVAALAAAGVTPGLAVVVVGDYAPSKVYVRHKKRACERVGINSQVHQLPAETPQDEVLDLIERLNADDDIHGILVQLPLPDHIRSRVVLRTVDYTKDADGFHAINMGKIATGRPLLAPCTPKGVMRMLQEYDVPIRGQHAVVVGRSRVVGRPMAALLLAADATVTTCHRHTPDTRAFTRQADILVVAVGLPGLVQPDWVKEGAVVIDVGITRQPDGRLEGDVAPAVREKARLMTPVPGGVGPMTIATLLDNTCLLAERLAGLSLDPYPLGLRR